MTDTDLEKAIEKCAPIMEQARVTFRLAFPYWRQRLNFPAMTWKPGLGTAGVTERGQILLDPHAMIEWSEKWGNEAVAGVLSHEILHLLLMHFLRREQREAQRWNIAADLFINSLLRSAGIALPPIVLYPEQFRDKNGVVFPDDLSAEEYYDLLEGSKNEQGEDGATEGNGQEGPCTGDCGSGAGGDPLTDEDGENAEPEAGAEGDDGERSPDELQANGTRAAKEAQAALTGGKDTHGTAGGRIARWAKAKLIPPTIPWERLIRIYGNRALSTRGFGARSYKRPNRRQACMGAHPRNPVLPSRVATTGAVWCAIDTSGSMSPSDIALAVSELHGLVRSRKAEVSVLACDAEVQGKPKLVRRVEDVYPMLTGGGGTNFIPIFEEAQSAQRKPDLLVIITDGFGDAPLQAPRGTEVIWVITPGGRAPVAWGQKIQVNKPKRR